MVRRYFTIWRFFIVWLFLMTKQYGALAKRFVDLDGRFGGNQDQIIAFLRTRTQIIKS